LALNGAAVAFGVLVVLRYARIPFFLYYPRIVNTVLLSDSMDLYAFFATGLCVPLSLAVLAIQAKLRELAHDVAMTRIAVLIMWLASLFLLLVSPSAAVVALLASVISNALLNLYDPQLVVGGTERGKVSTMLLPLTTIFALVEFAPVYYWGFAAADPFTQVGREAAELETNLTYALFPVASLILIVALFSWAWIPVATRLLKIESGSLAVDQPASGSVDRRSFAAAIDLILILAVMIFYFPYSAGQSWIVGVDSIMNYLDPIVGMSGMSIGAALWTLAGTFHGVYVGILFAIRMALGLSAFATVKFAPLALAVLSGSTTFWAFYKFRRNYRLAVLCAACAILWIPTAWGIFTGLQANWTAVWLWTLYLTFMWTWLNRTSGGWIYLLIQAIVSAAILLIHPWTWGLFAGGLVIFTLILIRAKSEASRRSIFSLISAFSLAALAGVTAMSLFPGVRKDLLDTARLYVMPLLNPQRVLLVWNSFLALANSWSSFLSPTILTICLLGSAGLLRRDLLTRYLSGWLFVSSIGVILAAVIGFNPNQPGPPDPLIWRVLYVSPIAVLLAFGLEMIFLLPTKLEPLDTARQPLRMREVLILIVVVALSGALLAASSLSVKIVGVILALALIFLASRRIPEPRIVRVLIVTIFVLIVVNAAFRSLYPLLLDPHNLHK
jgi:hypothetical protein